MGVYTTLNGLTLAADEQAGFVPTSGAMGADLVGMLSEAKTRSQELINLLNVIVARVPASDTGNIASLNAQITALS